MVQCGIRRANSFLPGKTCVECDAEDAAEILEAEKLAEDEIARLKQATDDTWYVAGMKRKYLKKRRQSGKKR